MKLSLKVTLFFLLLTNWVSAQYLHQDGKFIVDGNNNEFIIRSMGLGGWMLQEGYMLGTGGFAGTQHEIRALIEESMGKDRTDEFYDAWLANHCTKTDIDSLAAWGFNAVRIPLHYNLFTLPIEEEPIEGEDTWLETGFQMVDELVEWCKTNNMYVILDLHATPGGQGKNADISDYDPTNPSLWESSENQRKTIALWRKLAERYANEKYIGGYDLINETNWNFNGTNQNGCDSSNEKLRSFMIRITNAIREVDSNHILFVEGNCWANNMTGMFPAWDDNMAYSFHKYWNGTDRSTISDFLRWRDQYNVPMWMGESGENSNQWFYETINMLESEKVGWSWWPLKKIGSVVGPLTVVQTPEYDQLLDSWSNGQTPESDFCYETLMKMTENLMIENCVYHSDVIDAMFRQQSENTSIPYKKHEIPGVVAVTDYDMGRHEVAYSDDDYLNAKGNGGAQWNNGWTYRNDGVDIEASEDESELSNGYNVGWVNSGEWMLYTVDVKETGAYQVTFRVAGSSGNGKFHLELNNKNITGVVEVPVTTGNQDWTDVIVDDVILQEGTQQIKFYIDQSGFNVEYFQFSDPGPVGDVPAKMMNGYSNSSGNTIYLACNKSFDQTSMPSVGDFSVSINNEAVQVSTIAFDANDQSQLVLELGEKVRKGDQVLVSYIPGSLRATDESALEAFADLEIFTSNIDLKTIPGKIEAEDFDINNGLELEDCTDAGGGSDMGYTNPGDYLDYKVDITEKGLYEVSYRVSSGSTGGKIDLLIIDSDNQSTQLHTVTLPSTGDWQTWVTVKKEVNLPKGEYRLRVFVNQKEFNINWLSFRLFHVTGVNDPKIDSSDFFRVFPNPAQNKLYVTFPTGNDTNYQLKICNLHGEVLKISTVVHVGQTVIDLSGMENGMYFLQVSGEDQVACQQFIKTN